MVADLHLRRDFLLGSIPRQAAFTASAQLCHGEAQGALLLRQLKRRCFDPRGYDPAA